MFPRLCFVSHADLTLDTKVTTNTEHLNEHYKVHVFVLSALFAVQQSDDFVLLTALRHAGTHLPGPSDSVDTLTDLTCNQQRNKSWKKSIDMQIYYSTNLLIHTINFRTLDIQLTSHQNTLTLPRI